MKSRQSRQAARFVGANYKIGHDQVDLAEVGKIQIVWSIFLVSNPTFGNYDIAILWMFVAKIILLFKEQGKGNKG